MANDQSFFAQVDKIFCSLVLKPLIIAEQSHEQCHETSGFEAVAINSSQSVTFKMMVSFMTI